MKNAQSTWKYRYCSQLLFICGVLTCSGSFANNASEILAQLKLPHNATLSIVSDTMFHNGLPMAIGEFSAAQSPGYILSFYRKLWESEDTENHPNFTESATPGWLLISRLENEHQLVVQLSTERTRGTSGFVSVMPLDGEAKKLYSALFPGLSVLSSSVSSDGSDTSSMQVLASSLGSTKTHERYIKLLLNDGWQLLLDTPIDKGWVTILSRGRKRLELSFQPSSDYASVLVAHELESE